MKKLIIGSLAATLLAFVGTVSAQNVRTATGSVTQVFATEDGGALVNLSTGDRAAGGPCATANNRFVVDASIPGARSFLAVLLTARAAELPVSLDVLDDCASGGTDGVQNGAETPADINEFGPVITNVILQ